MKKIIFLSLLSIIFVSCGTSQGDIDTAKKDLLSDTSSTSSEKIVEIPKVQEQESLEWVKEDSLVQIIPLDANSPLSFDDISQRDLSTWEVIITGKILNAWGVDKIEVFFSNPTSKYPDDRYTLQAFRPWDENFKYIASSKNQVLDFGQNEYIFRAYSGIDENETKIILEVPGESEIEEKWKETSLIWPEENTIAIDLPTSSKYGEPLRLGESSFTYSQIKWLEISKEILEQVSCESLTEYLSERLNVWYYWNTCRDIVQDKWIRFNVIRLDEAEYVYESHYIDFIHGFYGVYELETGTGVNSENISEKNDELKNRDFPSLEIVNDLMKDIVNT